MTSLKELIFNLFIKKEWSKINEWLQVWLQDIYKHRKKILFLIECFKLIHPANLAEEFCQEFETEQNPLFSFYSFWESHKSQIKNISQLSSLYTQQNNRTQETSFYQLLPLKRQLHLPVSHQQVHPLTPTEKDIDYETFSLNLFMTHSHIHNCQNLSIKRYA